MQKHVRYTTYKCDICGLEKTCNIDEMSFYTQKKFGDIEIREFDIESDCLTILKRMDICNDCAAKIDHFIDTMKNNIEREDPLYAFKGIEDIYEEGE